MKRLAEPSTYAGIAVLFQVLKSFLPVHNQIYADGVSTVAAALAGFITEKRSTPIVP